MNESGYILAIPKPLLRRGWGGLFYHLGSTSMVTDYEGNVSQSVMYAPFGEVISEYKRGFDNDYITDYLFNGKELDEETGMYYFSARYYDPNGPFFISRDPLEEKYPGISPYAYCANNPLRYIDPTGMIVEHASFKDQVYTFLGKLFSSEFRKNYKILDKSKETYVFSGYTKTGKDSKTRHGNLSTDGDKIYINYAFGARPKSDGVSRRAGMYHETVHGIQFEFGELGFQYSNGVWQAVNFDVYDELEAKDAEYLQGTSLNTTFTNSQGNEEKTTRTRWSDMEKLDRIQTILETPAYKGIEEVKANNLNTGKIKNPRTYMLPNRPRP